MTNRLAQSASLYLRKHAENPIDWWPWCEAALAKARHERKPIFLSIGYSSCHWCTVMEGEAFSDPDVAAYMNAHFMPIKVDREERPDLDSIYMQALQMMTGQGGWPLNVFLSPDDRVPFYAGTYFPLKPRYGRPGFLQVLQAVRRYFDTETAELESIKTQIVNSLQQANHLPTGVTLTPQQLKDGLATSVSIVGARSFGNCFPMIPYAETALRATRFELDLPHHPRSVCRERGLALALGGIFDHVGGGFHRYTVDPTWTVPHFEKMLYDNGQIVEYLANLWRAGMQEPAFKRAIALTVGWLQREMTSPDGYFYAAQDADSFVTPTAAEPEEGAFYVWSYADLQAILTPAELAVLCAQFTVTESGNFEGKNVLQCRYPGILPPETEQALAQLFRVRYGCPAAELTTFPPACDNQAAKTTPWPGRIPPVTDTKLIVAWNSLMISGLARAYMVFQQPTYWQLATRAAQFICDRQSVAGRLHRLNYDGQTLVLAQSEDYAFLIKALLDLHQASQGNTPETLTPEVDWLAQAVHLQQEFDDFLWSTELGGYYNTASDASADLLVRERSYGDNATPSANGIAIANLIRLSLLTEDLQYLERAEQALQAFAHAIATQARSCPSLISALDWYYHYTLIRATPDRLANLEHLYLPTAVLKREPHLPVDAIALVCQGLSCQDPAQTETQLQAQMTQSQTRAFT
ncbi:thioredoxin domain-containing protein [Trichothermofontia sp.]